MCSCHPRGGYRSAPLGALVEVHGAGTARPAPCPDPRIPPRDELVEMQHSVSTAIDSVDSDVLSVQDKVTAVHGSTGRMEGTMSSTNQGMDRPPPHPRPSVPLPQRGMNPVQRTH